MKRVVSLYLPDWSIDRSRRMERRSSPPAEADGRADPSAPLRTGIDAIGADAAAERAGQCSVPRGGGWRPGARWAKSDPAEGGSSPADSREEVEAAIEAMPQHRRPPQRELGRVSQAADTPFRKGLSRPPEERVAVPAPLRELARRTEAADNPFRPMPPDEGGTSRRIPRRSARDGHGGEAGYVAPPNLARLAVPSTSLGTRMPSVQFPGEGPHPDKHGKTEPTAPTYGQGRFFQTGRTLGTAVARVCRDEEPVGLAPASADEPPLVLTHKVGPRVEVAAANQPARALGLTPGLALATARAQVPGLVIRAADPDGDRADLLALAELLVRRWAPTVAFSDADGLFVDLTGVAHLHGGEARFCRRLVRLLARHGIGARVGVADTAGAAWACARFGTGGAIRIVAPGAHAAALAPLPVAALRLEPASLELLARLGVDDVCQLLALPRAPLVRRFGRAIVDRLDQAAGRAPEPLVPVVPPTRIVVEQRFAEPIATPEAIEHWLRGLVAQLCPALAQAGQGARSVELVAARMDGVPQRLRLGFARATRDPEHMLRMALRRIEEIEPGYGIDGMALHVRRAEPLAPQSLAPALAEDAEPDLAILVDTLANRIGVSRLWRVRPVESDVPERSLALAPPLDPPPEERRRLKPDDVRHLDGRTPDHPWHPRWPRPVRLLHRPEEVDHVLAAIPDHPPKRFTWRGIVHRVVHAEGPERIAGEWWRRTAERHAVRDYYRVEDEAGARFWLFRRGDGVRAETGDLRWFLHAR